MSDAELAEFIGGRQEIRVHLSDVIDHTVADFREKLIHFAVIAFHDQFNPAIGEIPDIAANIVAKGDIFHCISKPNPLNMTREITGFAVSGLGNRRHEAG